MRKTATILGPLPTTIPEIPNNISYLDKSEKAVLVAALFDSLFFATPEYTYVQKILIFRDFLLKDYTNSRNKILTNKNKRRLAQLIEEL